MARYTELFAEYLENGGELPAVFSQIEGFEDLFIGEYCDRELGFETPVLFTIKLETKANIVIPEYKQRIDTLKALRENLSNPTKTRLKTGNISRNYGGIDETNTNTKSGSITRKDEGTDTHQAGVRSRLEAEQPMNPQAAASTVDEYLHNPTNVIKDNSYTDTDTVDQTNTESYNNYNDTNHRVSEERTDTETYNDVKEIESGYTSTELLGTIKVLDDQVHILLKLCLQEFEPLFMEIW